MKTITKIVAGIILATIAIFVPAIASADSGTFTVSESGITLPDGQTFPDNGHVNVTSTVGSANMHFESKCVTRTDYECEGKRHNDAQFIGQSFIPWEAFGFSGEFCVSWAQVAGFNYHFGENGESPVCVGQPPVDPTPVPTAPTFTDETCDAWPSYTIPETEGVRYFNGQYVLKSGTYEMQTRYRHLTLSAYDLDGNFLQSWNHVYTPPVGCEFPILWSFESGTDFTCDSFSYWHDIAYNTRIENAKSYEYKIEGAVNKTGTYTEPGSFSFKAPAGSKSYLTVWAVFDTYKLPIIERMFVLPKCDTVPPTTGTDGNSNTGGSKPSTPPTKATPTPSDNGNVQPQDTAKPATQLAMTGGSDTTMYIVTAGVALAVLGALVAGFAIMKRREDKDD
jgi:hypothetical protein